MLSGKSRAFLQSFVQKKHLRRNVPLKIKKNVLKKMPLFKKEGFNVRPVAFLLYPLEYSR